jgi:hypothetical protein
MVMLSKAFIWKIGEMLRKWKLMVLSHANDAPPIGAGYRLEKRAVANSSQRQSMFIMPVEQDGRGRDVRQQIQDLMAKENQALLGEAFRLFTSRERAARRES